MQTIKEIIEGCRLDGCSLEQRLAVVDYSSIPRQAEEAELIKKELQRRLEVAMREHPELYGKSAA